MTINLKEKLFSGILWSGSGKIGSMLANFVITIVLARELSPSDYGSYFIALTTIMIVTCSGMLGMDQIVVRFVAACIGKGDIKGAKSVIERCLAIVVFGATISSLLFWFLAPLFFHEILGMPNLATCIFLLVAWLFLATLQRQLAESFRGLNDIRMATIYGGVRSSGLLNAILVCVGMLILWMTEQVTLFNALVVMAITSVCIVFMSGITLTHIVHKEQRNALIQDTNFKLTIRSALYEGWPLWLATFINVVNNLGSGWLAAAFDSADRVALFGVAQRFMLLLIAPLVIVNSILPPLISQLYAGQCLGQLERVVRSVSGLLLIPTLMIFFVLVIAGRPLLGLLAGEYYQSSYFLLLILCIGQIINVATGTWQVVLPMTGARHQMFQSSVIAVSSQAIFGGIIGYFYGVYGVALAYCISMIITNVIGMFFVRKTLGIWTHASISWRDLQEVGLWISVRVLKRVKMGGAA